MAIPNIQDLTDDQLFSGDSEQPNSQNAYAKDLEIRRRRTIEQRALEAIQKTAAEAQIEAANAIVANSKWIRWSAFAVIAGAIVATASFAISLSPWDVENSTMTEAETLE